MTTPADERAAAEPASTPVGSPGPSTGLTVSFIAAVVVNVVLLIVLGVLFVRTDPSSPTSTATTSDVPVAAVETPTGEAPPPAPENPPPPPMRDGDLEFAVTGIDRLPSVANPATPEQLRTATGEYLLVKLRVTNVGETPQSFLPTYNKLFVGPTEYMSDDDSWVFMGNAVGDLKPGDSIDTVVVFDVPVGSVPTSIELHQWDSTQGVTVGL